uniref:E3 ubiquitin-protein ligase PPP1R11 n=1 Tax=Ciona savignyi TaxID=51511 RepID=H2Y9X4_CIOSA
MAESTQEASGSSTITVTQTATQNERVCLQPTRRSVNWTSDTVDNENMGKKSSKSCCIYKKPRKLGESSSESESDDDKNSYEKSKKKKKHKHVERCEHNDHPPDGNTEKS